MDQTLDLEIIELIEVNKFNANILDIDNNYIKQTNILKSQLYNYRSEIRYSILEIYNKYLLDSEISPLKESIWEIKVGDNKVTYLFNDCISDFIILRKMFETCYNSGCNIIDDKYRIHLLSRKITIVGKLHDIYVEDLIKELNLKVKYSFDKSIKN